MISQPQNVAIVGAGPAGLSAAKHFRAAGHQVQVYEAHTSVGGVWCFDNPESAAMKTTHLISSKKMTEFKDFPMPQHFPHYPHHELVGAYLADYAKHFNLTSLIQFNRRLKTAHRKGAGWVLGFTDSSEEIADILVVCCGHTSRAALSSLESFTGEQVHSSLVKRPDIQLRGKNVLVVGGGNSGCDLVCEATHHAQSVSWSLRRGYYFLPKFIMGQPADLMADKFRQWRAPKWLRKLLAKSMLRFAVGKFQNYGLPEPDHDIFEAHPSLNSMIYDHLGHGDIQIKPGIASSQGRRVCFVDGTSDEFDFILWATGFDFRPSFLEPKILQSFESEFLLNLLSPKISNLYMLGFIQPDSGVFWLLDLQAKLSANFSVLSEGQQKSFFRQAKKCHLALRNKLKNIGTERHRLVVDYFEYSKTLNQLILSIGS